MALGKNLKRVKKDSLIPSKKKEGTKTKAKSSSKKKMVKKTQVSEDVVAKPEVKKTENPKVADKTEAAQPVDETKQPSTKANLSENILVGGEEDSPITIKLFPSRRKSVRKTKFVMEGTLTLTEAEIIKDCLSTTFNDYDLIDIVLENVKQIDLAPIQLINVFKDDYPDKTVKVDSDLPFDTKTIIERAGFGKLMFKEEAA